jgi:FKBP-type peptidyl-prolyl cis-trans isomerase 2
VKIETGKRVRIKVRLKAVGGDVIEQSVVEYFQGAGTMLAGVEKAVDGLEAGAKKEGVIPAIEAFGNPVNQPKKSIPRAEFPKDAKLAKGDEFAAKAEGGQDVVLVVESADDAKVQARLCHPLYKKDIEYQVEIVSVTDPEPPPIPGAALKLKEDEEDAASAETAPAEPAPAEPPAASGSEGAGDSEGAGGGESAGGGEGEPDHT